MRSYLYQWFLLVLWIWITYGSFLSAERTSFFAYVGMLNNVTQVCGAPEWGSDTAYSKQENHLTCNRRPGKSDSYMGFDKLTHIPGNLEGWCMLKKDQRGPPVIYSSLVKHEARKWKLGHTGKLSDYWMCLNLIHRSHWQSKSLTASNCLSTTSDQLLVKHKLFWP